MKDFDADRQERYTADREFKIGGEIFIRKPAVRPEVMMAYEDLEVGATAKDSLKVIDDLIHAFIEPDNDAHARYDALRKQDDDPINIRDLNDIVRWLIVESTKRPTPASSLSSLGRDQTGTESRDASSTSEAAPSAA